MAASDSVIFSVSVFVEKKKQSTNKKIIQNAIRKISLWYDLFENVTENVTEGPDFPHSILENFEKINAKISV